MADKPTITLMKLIGGSIIALASILELKDMMGNVSSSLTGIFQNNPDVKEWEKKKITKIKYSMKNEE